MPVCCEDVLRDVFCLFSRKYLARLETICRSFARIITKLSVVHHCNLYLLFATPFSAIITDETPNRAEPVLVFDKICGPCKSNLVVEFPIGDAASQIIVQPSSQNSTQLMKPFSYYNNGPPKRDKEMLISVLQLEPVFSFPNFVRFRYIDIAISALSKRTLACLEHSFSYCFWRAFWCSLHVRQQPLMSTAWIEQLCGLFDFVWRARLQEPLFIVHYQCDALRGIEDQVAFPYTQIVLWLCAPMRSHCDWRRNGEKRLAIWDQSREDGDFNDYTSCENACPIRHAPHKYPCVLDELLTRILQEFASSSRRGCPFQLVGHCHQWRLSAHIGARPSFEQRNAVTGEFVRLEHGPFGGLCTIRRGFI